MDSEDIHALLEKYWKGETSQEEEETLRTWFRQPDIPDSLREASELFRYFDVARNQKIDDPAFDRKVITRVDGRRSKIRRLIVNAMRIAAGVVVLVMAVWLVRLEIRKTDPALSTDTYSDPELAFEETKKALLMISRSFNRAEREAQRINLFNEAQEEIRQEATTEE